MNNIELIVYFSASILFVVSAVTISVLLYLNGKKGEIIKSLN